MNATIRVEETRGGGSTFVVLLPLVECAGERKASTPELAAVAPAAPRGTLSVLLAEDDLVNRKLMPRLLQRLGCEVNAQENGLEVVEAVRAATFDIILMDIEMPELDGYGATRAVREHEAGTGRRTPIVALTAHVLPETRELCTAAGMDSFISKPVSVPDLVAAFEKWCVRPAMVAA